MVRYIVLVVLLLGISRQVAAEELQGVLIIPSMDCPLCTVTIGKALRAVSGVKQVQVNYGKKEVVIVYDESLVTLNRLASVVANTGYPATNLSEVRQ